MTKTEKSKRGFASMSPQKRREIASSGGRAVPAEKRAFSVDRSLAEKAGRKGGIAVPAAKRAFTKDRKLASDAAKLARKTDG